jgi:hypothetical protein
MNSEIPSASSAIFLHRASTSSFPPPLTFRVWLLGFGLFLGLCGLWLLVPALLQPKTIGLPQDRATAAAANASQSQILRAAEMGMIRGDLWAQAAFADSILLWRDRQAPLDKATAAKLARMRSTMETALTFAPVNGPGWLFLALLPASTSADNRVAAFLELAYFTAPNALELAPLRIERAAASSALAEKEIQEFVKTDIRKILAYRPNMKSAIVTAYRNAWPQNQPLFEALVTDADPVLGQTLRSGSPK